jgi:molecular chaperone GrpE (heat shock protein)
MAMEEMEELKSEAGASVYEKVLEVVDGLIAANGQHFAESACDEIFTIVYEWLDRVLAAEGYEKGNYVRELIALNFKEYIVQQ